MRVERKSVVDHGWRLRIDSFAHRVSEGRWIPYEWIVFVLRIVQAAIIQGGARIIINAPPRHGKSEGMSHWLPTWLLNWWPEMRIILASYGADFAAQWGGAVRAELEKSIVWTGISEEQALKYDWSTEGEIGGMRSAGARGSITGKGGDVLLIDDPHKNWEEALSPTVRQRIIDWFNATFYTRAEPGASIIVTQTRWHERDLSGYLINEHQDDWTVISLPAIAESLGDLLGRQIGDPLCPERYTREDLERIKRAIGSHIFAGLYQQRPAPLEGGVVKRAWLRFYGELPDELDEWLTSWDMSFRKTSSGSFVVGQVWARAGANFYLVDQYRARADFPTTLEAVRRMAARYPQIGTHLVESAANGPGIIDMLNSEIPGIVPVAVGRASKEARLAAVSSFIESGNVYIPRLEDMAWVGDFVEELCTFPNAAADDQCDALSQALDRFKIATPTNFKLNFEVGAQVNPWSLR